MNNISLVITSIHTQYILTPPILTPLVLTRAATNLLSESTVFLEISNYWICCSRKVGQTKSENHERGSLTFYVILHILFAVNFIFAHVFFTSFMGTLLLNLEAINFCRPHRIATVLWKSAYCMLELTAVVHCARPELNTRHHGAQQSINLINH